MDPKSILDYLDQCFLLKPESRGPQRTYIGANIGRHSFNDEPEVYCWSMGSQTYVKGAVRNVEAYIRELGWN